MQYDPVIDPLPHTFNVTLSNGMLADTTGVLVTPRQDSLDGNTQDVAARTSEEGTFVDEQPAGATSWPESYDDKWMTWTALPARAVSLTAITTGGPTDDRTSVAEFNVYGEYVGCPGIGAHSLRFRGRMHMSNWSYRTFALQPRVRTGSGTEACKGTIGCCCVRCSNECCYRIEPATSQLA